MRLDYNYLAHRNALGSDLFLVTVVNDYSGVGTYLTELLDIAARRVNREVLNQLPDGKQQRYHRTLDVFA